MSCTITSCDLVELVKGIWAADSALQLLLPADKLHDSTAAGDEIPYIVLVDLGETERSAYGPDVWGVTWTVRARVYAKSKAEALAIADALRGIVHGCHPEWCADMRPVAWGRVLQQPRGYVEPAVYMVQQLLQFKVII